MNKSFKVGFCVSGEGRLFRDAVAGAKIGGFLPSLLIIEQKASIDLEDYCREHNIPCHRLARQPRSDLDAELCRVCVEARLDLLVLTFDKLLPPSLVQHYAGRIINVHLALLPAFKGMGALDQTVASGVRFAGATIHEVDEEMDHGPVIAQCILGTQPHEDSRNLGRRLFPLLRLMYVQVITWYAAGRVAKDEKGRLCVRDAIYGEFPISPTPEITLSS